MSKSSDWQLRLGPFRFRIAVRTFEPAEPRNAPSGALPLPPAPGPHEVGRIRMLEEPVADGSPPAPEATP
jgi:hypothetical protein